MAGCLLATATAFEPQPTGAFHLAGIWLFCGLIPYVVYGSFTTLLHHCILLTTGILLLGTDLVARAGYGFTAAANPDPLAPVWLASALSAAVLPAGALLGMLLGRLPACRDTGNNPNK